MKNTVLQNQINTSDSNAQKLFRISSYIGFSLLLFNVCAFLLSSGYSLSLLIEQEIISPSSGGVYNVLLWLTSSGGQQLMELLLTVACEIITIYFLAKLLRFNILSLFAKPVHTANYTIKGSFLFVALNIVVAILYNILFTAIHHFTGFIPTSVSFDIPPLSDPVAAIITIFSMIFFAPILEELLFRGLILRSLQKYGNIFAILTSSILFGIFHGNLQQAIPLVISSIILGIVAVRTNSLWTCIIIHAVNNTFMLVFDFVSPYVSEQTLNIIYFSSVLIVIIAAIISWTKQPKDFYVKDYNISNLNKHSRLQQLIFSPGMIIALALYCMQLIGFSLF